MRPALSLKSANTNVPSNQVTLKNGAPASLPPAPPVGKLTRQIGTSNLRREIEKPVESVMGMPEIKENFEVFEDPDPVEEVQNNMIYELERKMEEKSREEEQERKKKDEEKERKQKFLMTRHNSEIMSVFSEPASEVRSVPGVYDDDDDKVSVASSTFTTIRASFSTFRVDGVKKKQVAEEKEAVKKSELLLKKKAEREKREELMFTSEEYFSDIFKYMCKQQKKFRAPAGYMAKQLDVNEEMRAILIDWFSDVVKEYRLQKETFHLAVSIVDRILSFISVDKQQFQLVGTTSLMIAAKYEEIFPPESEEFSIITDSTYRLSDILKMEQILLHHLKYVVGSPTAPWFGLCFAKRQKYTEKMNKSLEYLLDLSLVETDFLAYRPSDIAAAACCFTNVQYEWEAWPQKMLEDTGIKTDDFAECLKHLHRLYICSSTDSNKSIFTKYSDPDEKEVALLPAPTKQLRQLFPATFGARKTIPE